MGAPVHYRVLIGCNYRPDPKKPEVRHEPGDIVDDVPDKVAKHWLVDGVLGDVDVDHIEMPGPDGTPILVVAQED